jgi:8-hydroxy-5-deazaflavin:NADPH oxidoreductase
MDSRLGIIEAGEIGTAIARAAVAGGYDVAISGSGGVERIDLIVEVLAPGAHPVTTDDVARNAGLVVVAVRCTASANFRPISLTARSSSTP